MLPSQRGKGGEDDSDPAGQAPKQNSANSKHERLRERKIRTKRMRKKVSERAPGRES